MYKHYDEHTMSSTLGLTVKNHYSHVRAGIHNLSKRDKIIIKIILFFLLLELIGCLFVFRKLIFVDVRSHALLMENHKRPGPETEKFMNELKSNGLKPALSQKIKRAPFSGEGVLIAAKGDSMEVFEYSDHQSAVIEEEKIAEKYQTSKVRNIWKDRIHLYIKDRILVFYMGTEEDILNSLGRAEEISLFNKSPAITISSSN